jgi:hypothetical protein
LYIAYYIVSIETEKDHLAQKLNESSDMLIETVQNAAAIENPEESTNNEQWKLVLTRNAHKLTAHISKNYVWMLSMLVEGGVITFEDHIKVR